MTRASGGCKSREKERERERINKMMNNRDIGIVNDDRPDKSLICPSEGFRFPVGCKYDMTSV